MVRPETAFPSGKVVGFARRARRASGHQTERAPRRDKPPEQSCLARVAGAVVSHGRTYAEARRWRHQASGKSFSDEGENGSPIAPPSYAGRQDSRRQAPPPRHGRHRRARRQHGRAWPVAAGRRPAGRHADLPASAGCAPPSCSAGPTIPVTVVDLDDIVRGEFAENAYRKDFTLSEAVAIKRALEPIERAAAKERQREGSRTDKRLGKLPQVQRATPPTRPPRRPAWRGARWRRPRPSSTPPRPSRRSSASCSPTWTAPAASTASIKRLQDREAGRADPRRAAAAAGQWAVSRRHHRPAVAVRDARRRPVASRRAALPDDVHRRDLRAAGARRSCTRTRSSGCG